MSRAFRTAQTLGESSRCVAGPSRLPLTARYASTQAARPTPTPPPTIPTPASAVPYPFSSTAVPRPASSDLPVRDNLLHPKKGWSIIEHLNSHLRTIYDPSSLSTTLFARKSPERLRTGSIVTVVSWNGPDKSSTTSFSGVLIATRHRGVDTSFRVRNVVSRVGVEYAFKCCSPLLKEVTVIRRAKGKKGPNRDLGHRKAFWIRERPEMLTKIAQAVQGKNR